MKILQYIPLIFLICLVLFLFWLMVHTTNYETRLRKNNGKTSGVVTNIVGGKTPRQFYKYFGGRYGGYLESYECEEMIGDTITVIFCTEDTSISQAAYEFYRNTSEQIKYEYEFKKALK